ncbi:MAG: TonB-dependent receptor [Acidobacteria bacterium]|nr:MAG: TonB-dependent receptor [Acidobacteriota bacterium]
MLALRRYTMMTEEIEMRFSFSRPQVFVMALAAWLSVGILCAQQATVQGVVTDSTAGRIPGAEIKVTNVATGTSQSVLTNDEGFYSIPFLIPGTYRLEVSLTGFATARRDSLKLDVDKTARVDVELQVGELSQTVEVPGTSAIMDTETSVVGQVIDNKRIVELPLNGRNYLDLARLTVAVAPDTGSRTSSKGTFSSAGQHAYQTNVLLDGIDNNSRASGGQLGYEAQGVTPSIDAVSEFKVVTNNNSAEYGFRMGGTVIVQTKSGSNQFHGSLHEFVRNEIFDAKNFFAGNENPPYKRNQFGGTFGGRIVPDKLFFFGSYEGTRIRVGESNTSTVPTLAFRRGDFTGSKTIYNPATTGQVGSKWVRDPFPGNQIPATQFDAVASKIINLYPEPNVPGAGVANNYSFTGSRSDDTNQYDSRIDWYASERNRVFGRYSRRQSNGVDPGPLPLPADGGQWQTTTLTSNNVVGNWNLVVSPTMFNEVRAGGVATRSILDVPWDENYNSKLGIAGLPDFGDDNSRGMSRFNATNYAFVGTRLFWPNRNNFDFLQLSDHLTVVKGVHVLKGGVEFRREKVFRRAARYGRGAMSFNGSFSQDPSKRASTGDPMADFLLGLASGGFIGNQNGETAVTRNYSLYFQDDWKIASRLTLNLGVRWDRFGPPSFKETPVSRFEFTPGDQDYRIVYPADESDVGGTHDNNNFAPRIGLAFQAAPKTVLRLGFGIYYGEPDALTQDGDGKFAHQPPEYTEIGFTTDRLKRPALIVSQGYPTGLFPATGIQRDVTVRTAEKYMPSQYSQQWFLDLQRELPMETVLTVSYIGGATRHISYTENLNEVPGPGSATVEERQPWPYFNLINKRNAGANANYNALTAKAEKRFSRGMTYLMAYTWSHAIDEGAGVLDDGTLGAGFRSIYHRDWNRGNSNYDVRHNFVTSLVYDLPFGQGRRLGGDWNRATNALLGGWQLGGILTMRTGQPFSPTVNEDVTNTQTTNYPNRVGVGDLPPSERSIDRWFDLSAFAVPDDLSYGNSGRNILFGPGFNSIDLKIGKNFYFGDERRLEFRCEMFDFTNTPHFGLPGPTSTDVLRFTSIDATSVGQIRTAYEPRRIQFGLKLAF